MRLSLLLPCVVVGMIGVSLFAQTDGEPGTTPSDSGGLFERVPQPVEATADHEHDHAHDLDDGHTHDDAHTHEAGEAGTEQSVTAEERKLRQQYLELIEQKSSHMDRSALREAISRAEGDVDELKADEKLQQAKQLLLELVQTHPQTSAAQTARAMLQADPRTRTLLPTESFSREYEPFDVAPADDDGLFPPSTNVLPSSDFEQPERRKTPVRQRPQKRGSEGDDYRLPVFEDESSPVDG